MECVAKRLITKVKVSHARTKLDRNLLVINSVATCKLNVYVQDVMKTSKYQKWCFDQIEGIVADNKVLTAEVDGLRAELENDEKEKVAQSE